MYNFYHRNTQFKGEYVFYKFLHGVKNTHFTAKVSHFAAEIYVFY